MAGKRIAKVCVVLVAVVAAAAAVVAVATAPLEGNSRANQQGAAYMSLPLWATSCVLVWLALRRNLVIGIAGAALVVVGALIVLSDPSLKDDGLGVLVYVGMPLAMAFAQGTLLFLAWAFDAPKDGPSA